MEIVKKGSALLGIIIRANDQFKKTTFFSDPQSVLQVGILLYQPHTKIRGHTHARKKAPALKKPAFEIEEVLYIKKGLSVVEFYSVKKEFVCRRRLSKGDLLIFVSGGHSFNYVKRSEVIEIKQGPFNEKNKRFI